MIVIALLLVVKFPARAEDCEKARDIYQSTVKLSDLHKRVAGFQRAAELCPGFAEAHVNLADAYEKLSATFQNDVARFNELLNMAAAEYREALKHKRKMFSAYLGLGDTYRVMGLYDKSQDAYNKALQVKPDDPRALLGLNKIKVIKMHDVSGFQTSKPSSSISRDPPVERSWVTRWDLPTEPW